jgi:hypothetical protein
MGLQYRSTLMIGVVFVGVCLAELVVSYMELKLISVSVEKLL